ncbi:hypothetical protein [Bifidobacterium xylocopae]|uniref:Uncharacterized protein n=1 Tax=Bifidobacterium xylocopae TaxID=2493119 RepID=A0A366KEC1_9BIFI|nr:hypothetical protein [Bifidobacterium xylocopae]RBQ00051.1 hypothetical protein CRD59_00895 [Bifidobacterium xylocopae]
MSLNLAESTLVLAKIRAHHGNATITDLEARTFQEELRADATLADAMEAVRRFYADNTTGRWMGSGDVNAGIKVLRKSRIPEAAERERLIASTGHLLDNGAAYVTYRQQLNQSLAQGRTLEQAHTIAVQAAQQLAIEPAKPDDRKPLRSGQSRLGAMSIKQIVGK